MKETSSTKKTASTGMRVGKISGYTHKKADARKNKRRDEAEDRQAQYNELTVNEKIAHAKSHRGESKKQIARLIKLGGVIAPTSEVKAPKTEAVKVPKTPKAKSKKNAKVAA